MQNATGQLPGPEPQTRADGVPFRGHTIKSYILSDILGHCGVQHLCIYLPKAKCQAVSMVFAFYFYLLTICRILYDDIL